MSVVESNTVDVACFEVNEHGRLISGNRRFCRLFGFNESEIPWHYVTDLYRHVADWETFKNAMGQDVFEIRMKNRKGRSFCCKVVREIIQKDSGEIVFKNMVCRKSDAAVQLSAQFAAHGNSLSVVFLGRCDHCGAHVRVNTVAEARMKMLCDNCAVKAYPEAYHIKEGQM